MDVCVVFIAFQRKVAVYPEKSLEKVDGFHKKSLEKVDGFVYVRDNDRERRKKLC